MLYYYSLRLHSRPVPLSLSTACFLPHTSNCRRDWPIYNKNVEMSEGEAAVFT